jgi:glycosyltransferase involved in cell wall biosynthesis
MNLSIVISVFNEDRNLAILFDEITQAMAPLPHEWEVIFVDDGSTDKSLEVLKEIAEKDPLHVRIVVFRRNFGQTAAITAGIDHSLGEIIILMDADLQNDPADIP